ncbi:MAG: hypothetical protein WCD37_20980 [Chloroflexia bacterium]
MVDAQDDITSDDLLNKLDNIRELILKTYRDAASPQLEVWVVASPIVIVAGGV